MKNLLKKMKNLDLSNNDQIEEIFKYLDEVKSQKPIQAIRFDNELVKKYMSENSYQIYKKEYNDDTIKVDNNLINVRYLQSVISSENIEHDQIRFIQFINDLLENKIIGHGFLSPLSLMPLAVISRFKRYVFFTYCYPMNFKYLSYKDINSMTNEQLSKASNIDSYLLKHGFNKSLTKEEKDKKFQNDLDQIHKDNHE